MKFRIKWSWPILLCLFSFFVQSAESKIMLTRSRGQIFVEGKLVNPPYQLHGGNEVEARGEKSFALIRYPSGDQAVLRNGKIVLDSDNEKNLNLKLEVGILFNAIVPKSRKKVKIQTKHASMGVRGTKFMALVDSNHTYLCVCEGKVEIKNRVSSKVVSAEEDTNAEDGKKINVKKAQENMWKMNQEGFALMGIKIKPLK